MKKRTLNAIIAVVILAAVVITLGIGSSWFTNGNVKTWFNNWGAEDKIIGVPGDDDTVIVPGPGPDDPDDPKDSDDPVVETYSVVFELVRPGGYTETHKTLEEVRDGATVLEPTDVPVIENYAFNGWYHEDTFVTAWNFRSDTVSGDTVIFGNYIRTYTVEFEMNGGFPAAATLTDIRGGAVVAEPEEPEKATFVFAGWYSDPEFTQAWDFETDVVTDDLTLYAKFVPGEAVNVTYVILNEDVAPTVVEAYIGGRLTEPDVEERDGYYFDGWYTDETCADVFLFTQRIEGEMTLYARYLELYTVSTVIDGELDDTYAVQIASGHKISGMTTPVKPGYIFNGWYKDAEHTQPWNMSEDIVSENTTLYGYYEETDRYTVIFDVDGDKMLIQAQSGILEGGRAEMPAAPTKPGYIFVGWCLELDAEQIEYWNFSDDVVTSDIILYARFIELHTVTFVVENEPVRTLNVPDNTLIYSWDIPQPSREGYRFDGWYDNADFSGDPSPVFLPVISDMTYYGRFAELLYTVTFNVDGDTEIVSPIHAAAGQSIYAPAAPYKANHVFDGWYIYSDFYGGAFSFPYTVDRNRTFYAKYSPVYTVTFNIDGDIEIVDGQSGLRSGAHVTQPPTPTRDGYMFDGWFTSAQYRTRWAFSTNTIGNSNITLYGHFEQIAVVDCTVNYYDGYELYAMQTVHRGLKLTPPQAPSGHGRMYEFDGWYDSYGVKWAFEFSVVDSDMSLYARFELQWDAPNGSEIILPGTDSDPDGDPVEGDNIPPSFVDAGFYYEFEYENAGDNINYRFVYDAGALPEYITTVTPVLQITYPGYTIDADGYVEFDPENKQVMKLYGLQHVDQGDGDLKTLFDLDSRLGEEFTSVFWEYLFPSGDVELSVYFTFELDVDLLIASTDISEDGYIQSSECMPIIASKVSVDDEILLYLHVSDYDYVISEITLVTADGEDLHTVDCFGVNKPYGGYFGFPLVTEVGYSLRITLADANNYSDYFELTDSTVVDVLFTPLSQNTAQAVNSFKYKLYYNSDGNLVFDYINPTAARFSFKLTYPHTTDQSFDVESREREGQFGSIVFNCGREDFEAIALWLVIEFNVL